MDRKDFDKLKAPFPADDIDWRVQSAGTSGRGIWAKVLAYIDARAVMDRLDEVCHPENWQFEVIHTTGGFIGRLGIRINNEWVWKSDGSDETKVEATKGGISGSFKRSAVHWGIGRYLYNLKEGYADIQTNGVNYQSAKQGKYEAFKWNPPKLPVWALPEGESNAEYESAEDTTTDAESDSKSIEQVIKDIEACTVMKHLVNIYDKYIKIFTGEDKTKLIMAKDIRKGELK